jgi:RNA polymerase sigma-70 factor (ECF subfamily)
MSDWQDLESALAALPVDTRFILWMHEVEGYTHAELAALLGRTASYSKSQLARGMARLRESARVNGSAHDR